MKFHVVHVLILCLCLGQVNHLRFTLYFQQYDAIIFIKLLCTFRDALDVGVYFYDKISKVREDVETKKFVRDQILGVGDQFVEDYTEIQLNHKIETLNFPFILVSETSQW